MISLCSTICGVQLNITKMHGFDGIGARSYVSNSLIKLHRNIEDVHDSVKEQAFNKILMMV